MSIEEVATNTLLMLLCYIYIFIIILVSGRMANPFAAIMLSPQPARTPPKLARPSEAKS